MAVPKIGWILLLITTIVTFAFTLVVNYYINTGVSLFGLNFTSVGDVSDKYHVEITPAGWTFSIWAVIYTWQLAWCVYALTLICRSSAAGGKLYYNPPFFSSYILIAYICNLICNSAWIFVWTLEYVNYALLFIALIPFFLYLCLIASFYGLRKYGQDLIDGGKKNDVIATIVVVQNGLGIYATWVTIATLINVSIVLHYSLDVALETSDTICLSILAAELVLWFMLDNFVFEKACRYFFVPYCVVIHALSGVIDANWEAGSQTSIITAVLLAVCCALLIVKVVLVILRSRTKPLFEWYGSKIKPVY